MSDSKSHSNRHKKKVVKEGLQELKNKPGWDVEAFVRRNNPEQQLRDFDQDLRGNQVYDESGGCGQCEKARRENGDETALCDEHLAAAMGFGE